MYLSICWRVFKKQRKEALRMLFFLRALPKRDSSQSPSMEYLEQVVKEWEAVIDFREEGKVLEAFCFANGKGAFSVWDVASREKLDKIVSGLPMYPFADWEIIPLWTAEETLEKAKQALGSVRS
jgi:muconolactone delta-isomerase